LGCWGGMGALESWEEGGSGVGVGARGGEDLEARRERGLQPSVSVSASGST
jgi:hypothetical protein